MITILYIIIILYYVDITGGANKFSRLGDNQSSEVNRKIETFGEDHSEGGDERADLDDVQIVRIDHSYTAPEVF